MAVEGSLFSGDMWRFDFWVACSSSRRGGVVVVTAEVGFDPRSRLTVTLGWPSRSLLTFLLCRSPIGSLHLTDSLHLSIETPFTSLLRMPPTTTTKSAPRKYGGKSKWDLRALGVVSRAC